MHVYFDNDARGHAPWDAVRLLDRLGVTTAAHDAPGMTRVDGDDPRGERPLPIQWPSTDRFVV